MLNILSLSAGVQSSTILHMSIRRDRRPVDAVIYLNAGWEPNYTLRYAEYLANLCAKNQIPFLHKRGPSIRENLEQLLRQPETNGKYQDISLPLYTRTPEHTNGQLPRHCTRAYRLRPLFAHLRKVLPQISSAAPRGKPYIRMLLGISKDEEQRAAPSAEKWKVNAYPLIDAGLTRNDCINYMILHGLPVPSRSSCACCPYRSNLEWRRLAALDPTNWDAVCRLDVALRNLGRPHSQLFLHQSRRPLSAASIDSDPICT